MGVPHASVTVPTLQAHPLLSRTLGRQRCRAPCRGLPVPGGYPE